VGNGPHKRAQFPGDGDHHAIGVLASGHQVSIAFAQSHLRLPADILEGLGPLFQTQVEMTADLRRIPVGPGTFEKGAAPGLALGGVGTCCVGSVRGRRPPP
jgi:hypothetical protein